MFITLSITLSSIVVPAPPVVDVSDSRDIPAFPLFKGLEIQPVVLQGDDSDQTLGLRYTYTKSLARFSLTGSESKDFDLAFDSSGTIAVERALNPEDLIEAKLAIRYTFTDTGVPKRPERYAPGGDDTLDRLALKPGVRLSGRVFAGHESDQSFLERHTTFGLGGFAKYQIPEDRVIWWNIFDYPATALRWLTGYDVRSTGQTGPMGLDALPSVGVDLERIAPSGDDPRADIGDGSDFTRASLRLALSSPVFDIGGGDESDEVSLTAAWRYYAELDADQAVKDAGLDKYNFLVVSLKSRSGFVVSYTNGQLPFDEDDGESFQVGWSHSF